MVIPGVIQNIALPPLVLNGNTWCYSESFIAQVPDSCDLHLTPVPLSPCNNYGKLWKKTTEKLVRRTSDEDEGKHTKGR